MLHPVPTLDDRVAIAVAGVLEQHAGELEQIVAATVDRELDRMLATLVERELESRANGATDTAAEVSAPELERSAPRLCSECGTEPALDGRRIGRACKTARDRGRARRRTTPAADSDEDRPAGIAPFVLAANANHRVGSVGALELSDWLTGAGLATLEAGLLVPTARGLELGAGLHPLERD